MKLSYSWRDTLGTGGYGSVYAAKVTSSSHVALANTVVAMKKARVTNHVRHPMVLHEACALLRLRGHQSIPQAFAWGRSQYFEYLAMERLGQNIRDAVEEFGLTQRNLVILICQMLDAIEYIHQKKIIHCDVKTTNFVFGQGANLGRLYLIDFGLCRPWSDHDTGKRLQMGTIVYTSERVLRGHAPARRDDMESLAYTIVDLLTGSIPWDNESDEDFCIPPTCVDGKSLCGSYHPVFGRFVDYTRALKFAETPQYRQWREAFRELAPGLPENPLFDRDDDSLPRVGVRDGSGPTLARCPTRDLIVLDHHEEEISRRVYGTNSKSGTIRFLPLHGSSWGEPTALSHSDLLGDELKIVTSTIELIEEPPMYNRGRTVDRQCAEEVMNNTQSHTHYIHQPYVCDINTVIM
ncbi:kinase-like domain-containing protein [Ganoderma leucocontextum]|nr:kinase-like domain-containing protein [Ganoderma leucocontextum]